MRMKPIALCCLLPIAAVAAQDAAPTPAAQYKALTDEFDAASKAWMQQLRAASTAKDKDAQEKLMQERPAKLFLPRFVDFAKSHPDAEEALPCLCLIVQNDPQFGEAAHFAMEQLVTAHPATAEFAKILPRLKYSIEAKDHADAMRWFATIAAQNPDAEIKAQALLARASLCIGTTGNAETAAEREGAIEDLQNAIELSNNDKFKASAQEAIDEENLLGVGKMAPDIEGTDLDGVAFKLSDYRGKVVMLDFWGDW